MMHKKPLSSDYKNKKQNTTMEVVGKESLDGVGIGGNKGLHKGSHLSFSDFLHFSSLRSRMISMINLVQKGFSIVFKGNRHLEVM